MKQIMCVRLTCWPVDRIKRKSPRLRLKPLVLVNTVAARRIIAIACDIAQSKFIRVGMTLTEANALCHGLIHQEYQPENDARSLEGFARWLIRFSPHVMPAPPDAVLLDVTGSERLFNGFDRLLRLVTDGVSALGIAHGVAIAPTVGAAWALASFGNKNIYLELKTLPKVLQPLPLSALRLNPDTLIAFHGLGVELIGQLFGLPRDMLITRFGPLVLIRLDQALGRVAEPIVPLAQREPIVATIECETPIDRLDMIEEVLRRLLVNVVDQLRKRECGARQIVASFFPPRSPAVKKTIQLSRPSNQFGQLFNLIRCVIETVRHDDGFTVFKLVVPTFDRLTDEQLNWADQTERHAEAEFDHLVERLRVMMGHSAVAFPKLIPSHAPEHAFGFSESPEFCPVDLLESFKPRPLRLLASPEEVQCMATPDGRPLSLTRAGKVSPVIHAGGPERIAGIWWDGRDKTRDYFDVEDATGRRYWLFRVGENGRWFLHGFFD